MRRRRTSLDLAAERIFTLHRCRYPVKLMQTKDMRNEHDLICSWVFDKDPQIPVFTEGTDKMDRDDMRAVADDVLSRKWAGTQSWVARRAKPCSRLGLEDDRRLIWLHTDLLPA